MAEPRSSTGSVGGSAAILSCLQGVFRVRRSAGLGARGRGAESSPAGSCLRPGPAQGVSGTTSAQAGDAKGKSGVGLRVDGIVMCRGGRSRVTGRVPSAKGCTSPPSPKASSRLPMQLSGALARARSGPGRPQPHLTHCRGAANRTRLLASAALGNRRLRDWKCDRRWFRRNLLCQRRLGLRWV